MPALKVTFLKTQSICAVLSPTKIANHNGGLFFICDLDLI